MPCDSVASEVHPGLREGTPEHERGGVGGCGGGGGDGSGGRGVVGGGGGGGGGYSSEGDSDEE